jgi:hypothetical protein
MILYVNESLLNNYFYQSFVKDIVDIYKTLAIS